MFYKTQKKIQMILLYEIKKKFIFLFSILYDIVHYIFCDNQIAHNVEQLTGLQWFFNSGLVNNYICNMKGRMSL